jgi:hypothetical protein
MLSSSKTTGPAVANGGRHSSRYTKNSAFQIANIASGSSDFADSLCILQSVVVQDDKVEFINRMRYSLLSRCSCGTGFVATSQAQN